MNNFQCVRIKNIRKLKYIWDKYSLEQVSGVTWERLLKEYLFKAVRRIEVRPVNQKTGARGLKSIIEDSMIDLMYNAPDSDASIVKVIVKNNKLSFKTKKKVA